MARGGADWCEIALAGTCLVLFAVASCTGSAGSSSNARLVAPPSATSLPTGVNVAAFDVRAILDVLAGQPLQVGTLAR